MTLLILPIMIPMIAAILCFAFGKSVIIQRVVSLFSCIAQLSTSVYLLFFIESHGIQVLNAGNWQSNIGIVLVSDLFSAIMLVVTNLISLLVLIYSFREIDLKVQTRYYFPLFNFLTLGVNGAFLTGDIFNLYVWFEIMLLSSFILLTLGRKADQLEGAVKYVILNLFSSFLFLIGVGILYAKVGSLNMADIALKLSMDQQGYLINSTAIIFLVSFGIKAALFPFFFWLPASYHTPPTSISAIFAGLLTKVGIYALVRVFSLIFVSNREMFQEIFYVLAILTMVIGVLCAAAQFEIRKILSVHIVSQIGYMILGLAIFTPFALAAAIFYIIHNIIVKTNLFLISGIIQRQKGTVDLKLIGGLYSTNTFLALLFCISAFSLAGIPPLSGFWAKFAILKAAAFEQSYISMAVALAVSVITMFSMTKIWSEAFWKAQPDVPESNKIEKKYSKTMYFPVIILTLCTISLGVFGGRVFEICLKASNQLMDSQQYIRIVLGGQ